MSDLAHYWLLGMWGLSVACAYLIGSTLEMRRHTSSLRAVNATMERLIELAEDRDEPRESAGEEG